MKAIQFLLVNITLNFLVFSKAGSSWGFDPQY